MTVRLPVTAVASAGTLPTPVTWNVRALPETKAPDSPTPIRVSRIRTGGSAVYVDGVSFASSWVAIVLVRSPSPPLLS